MTEQLQTYRNTDITRTTSVRVVLFEKINNPYHYKKLDIVKEKWQGAKHPSECRGNCKLTNGMFMTSCKSCGWDDY